MLQGILVKNIKKNYKEKEVLKDINFQCFPGTITGLIGPNGSGKTTIMRIMTNLCSKYHGSVTFNGIPYKKIVNPAISIGTILDATAQHPGRTVYETIRIAAMLTRIPKERVINQINYYGLSPVIKTKFDHISLGMKQRVALAIATLGNPEFLILDEPMNGLDQETSLWLRNFMVSFAKERNGTVILSSHMLSDLQEYIDNVVVINNGYTAAQTPISQIESVSQIDICALDNNQLCNALIAENINFAPSKFRYGYISAETDSTRIGYLVLKYGVVITHLEQQSSSMLKDYYIKLTQGDYQVGQGPNNGYIPYPQHYPEPQNIPLSNPPKNNYEQ